MVASSRDSISQRVSLVGDDDVRRRLEQIAATGEQSFNRVGSSAGQLRFAMQNLSFQVNDLVTGFASGQPPMRIFAQQGGQIVEAFQQGGGFGNVLGAAATKLKEFLTPTRALAGLGAAAAAGVGLLALRAQDADSAMRQFATTLKAVQPSAFATGPDILKNIGITPEKLEQDARALRSVGLSFADAKKEITQAIAQGIDARFVNDVIKFGKDLEAAFPGNAAKSAEAFKKAIEGGPEALRKFGESIGVINPNISALQDGLKDIPSLLRKILDAPNIKGAAQSTLSPLAKDARDINVQFQEMLDKITTFGTKGFVNLVNTVKAGGDLFRSLFDAINRGDFSGLSRGLVAAFTAAIDSLKNIAANLFKSIPGVDNLVNTVNAAIDLVNSLFDAINRRDFSGLSRGLVAAFDPLKNIVASLIDANKKAWIDFFTSLPRLAAQAMAAGTAQLASEDPIGLGPLISASIDNMKNVLSAVGPAVADAFLAAGPLITDALKNLATTALSSLQQLFEAGGQTMIDALVNAFSSADPFAPLEERAQSAIDNIRSRLQSVLDFASSVGDTIAQALSSAAGAGAIPGFAAGGLIRGPGTGTSDSVPLWASTGEFIVNAAATRANLPLLQAINSLSQPIVPRSRGFAMGGLVTAGAAVAAGPGSVVNLTIGAAGPFPLRGDREIVDAVGREARKAQLLSGGKKPSWKT